MKTLWGLVLALGLGCAGSALGAPVTFAFAGTVTDDPFGLSSFGAPISGRFSFDAAVPDSIAGFATGSFASVGAGFGFTVNVDGTLYASSGALTVNTANNIVAGDQYGVIATDAMLTLEIFFQDSTAAALSSDALSPLPPALAGFDFRQFRLFGVDAEFLGTVESLACISGCTVAVPETGTLSLVLLALALTLPLVRQPRPDQRHVRIE